jgi:hypothetical protein
MSTLLLCCARLIRTNQQLITMPAKSPSTTTTATAPYELIDIEMQFLSRLMTIIESQQWDVLGNAILNNQEVFRTFARSIASSPSQHLNGMTM